jgi:hypothetical protein
MSQRTDWLTANREEQLAMARDWQSVMGTKTAQCKAAFEALCPYGL